MEIKKKNPFTNHLKEIVYGGSDGIVTTFAIVAGFAGANSQNAELSLIIVLIFGLANLFADATSMGLGNFLSIRSDQDLYQQKQKKELKEILENKEHEISETVSILKARGFDKVDAHTLSKIYSKNKDYWLDFMMNEEHRISDPRAEKPVLNGIITSLSFIVFGFIPLAPYFFIENGMNLFTLSIIFTFIALLCLGILRWRVTKQTIIRSLGETVIVGSLSAVIAYFVGTLFR
jgi:VIT1/CCC1 family predicted Fe2+/Mn2+ transporter